MAEKNSGLNKVDRDDEDALNHGKLTDEHRALKNQGSVNADQYPQEERESQSLVRKDAKKK